MVQPDRHLDDEALAEYRRAIAGHPARLLWIRDFLDHAVARSLAAFLAGEAQFATEHGLYSVDGAVDERQWLAAGEDDSVAAADAASTWGTADNYNPSHPFHVIDEVVVAVTTDAPNEPLR